LEDAHAGTEGVEIEDRLRPVRGVTSDAGGQSALDGVANRLGFVLECLVLSLGERQMAPLDLPLTVPLDSRQLAASHLRADRSRASAHEGGSFTHGELHDSRSSEIL